MFSNLKEPRMMEDRRNTKGIKFEFGSNII